MSSRASLSSSRNDHRHQRRFIGPMPEQVLSDADLASRRKKKWWSFRNGHSEHLSSLDDDDRSLKDVIKTHAYQFFIRHGGRDQDWGEDKEHSITEEMFRRWRQSDWTRLHEHRRRNIGSRNWVGSSFEVGNFLGINILEDGLPSTSSAVSQTAHVGQPSTHGESFVTAPSYPILPSIDQQSSNNQHGLYDDLRIDSPSSSTPLLQTTIAQGRSEIFSDSIPLPTSQGDTYVSGVPKPVNNKGKGKLVHYADDVAGREPIPAPPMDVLARTGSAVDETSAGATYSPSVDEPLDKSNLIMSDRMLVRVSYTRSDTVDASFNENTNRTTHHLEYQDWAEFLVIWRKKRLELYEDYSVPGKEWILGHKHLAFIVPLNNQQTRLSLYSFVDLTFCFVCPPTAVNADSTSRLKFNREKSGRNIFVFKTKSRSRSEDWLWRLWRHLGGLFPPSIEIRSPMIDARIRVDIPHVDIDEEPDYAVFNRDNIIDLCHKSLKTVEDYRWLLQTAIDEGGNLELAWRMEMKLDWVWQFTDVEGKPRNWAVLYGLSQRQGDKPAHLEVRLQQHNPLRVHLKDGTRLDEPPAVEGYLNRIRSNGQIRRPIYLAVHNGYLFSTSPHHAIPPNPPGMLPESTEGLSPREAEMRRGCKQILHATGVTDLHNIVAVRRAFQLIPRHEDVSSTRARTDEDIGIWEEVETTDSDDEDTGGEDGLAGVVDKGRQRMRRSFELVLTNGQVVRFEAHSRSLALEWIYRLRALVTYWMRRHQLNAKEEMDLAYFGTGKPRLTPFRPIHISNEESPPDPPPDPDTSLPDLSSIYSWCLIKGCRPILKCAKLYVRKGLRGPYQKVQLVLVAGHLIQFRISRSLHYHKSATINLLDAYVCSGYFAAQALPKGQFNPDAPPLARRYQDGLETEDPEDDTLFTMWYLPHALGTGNETGHSVTAQVQSKTAIPPLSAKKKIVLFRTRSKLERDAWCWALNTEIEKLVRASPERESKLRETADIIRTEN